MSAFEVFCCLQAVVYISNHIIKGTTKYEELKAELLEKEILKTLSQKDRTSRSLWLFIESIANLIITILDFGCVIILCRVISRVINIYFG